MDRRQINRTLWHETPQGRTVVGQADLLSRDECLVILGEAGMGKSHLLEWLGKLEDHAFCTARQLINRPDPRTLLGDKRVLVIDALDEVAAQREGDAVDLVLRKLGELEYPRFVMSCRVADWRSATGVEAIREQYDRTPIELHLNPFSDEDIVEFLETPALPRDRAKQVIEHFEDRGLSSFLGNPQTLELIAAVAEDGELPRTRGELFKRAMEVLRVEVRPSKKHHQLAEGTVLDAAGAAFAAQIITGSEAIVRRTSTVEGEIGLADIMLLPGGEATDQILGSRLFKADAVDRFTYWHRRVGEYLGALWLAKQADTKRKRRRLLSLFHAWPLVPANLRGIHAWLAKDPHLAPAVIAADPMGVLEYGDADNLSAAQARQLLSSLEELAKNEPWFRGWGRYSLRGIAQPALVEDIRRLIKAPTTPFGVRVLVLEGIKGAEISTQVATELRSLVLDPEEIFASRRAAGEALAKLESGEDWPELLRQLEAFGDELSIRLAIELTDDIGYAALDDSLITDLVIAHAQCESRTVGVLMHMERCLPNDRLAGVLDVLADKVRHLGKSYERKGNNLLTDLAYALIVRKLSSGDAISADQLWSWIEPFDFNAGYQREARNQFAVLIKENHALRQAVQRRIILSTSGDANVWQRALRLTERSPGLATTPEDVIALLAVLDPADRQDERWREIIQLTNHDGQEGAEVRQAALPFASHRPDLTEWVEQLAEAVPPKWQQKEAERQRKRRAKQAVEWAEHRRHYSEHIEELRAGNYGLLVGPAKAYLKLFADFDSEMDARGRLLEWLGPEIAEAAGEGFEKFLTLPEPKPTAEDIARAFAEGKHWPAAHIIVAALAERVKDQRGFEDLPDERLMAGLFELRQSDIEQHAGIEGVQDELATALRTRGGWEGAMRLYHEPQLETSREHVHGLYQLVRDDPDAKLAADLAMDWLQRFPDLPRDPESELIDRLLQSDRREDLRQLLPKRTSISDIDRRRNWDAVGLIVAFDTTVSRLAAAPIEPELLWHIRERSGGRFDETEKLTLGIDQLEWVASTFRFVWPVVHRPEGVTSGNTNEWDAADYIRRLISRLGNETSDEARAALQRLRAAPEDGYSEFVQNVIAEQTRKRVEAQYAAPSLAALHALVENEAPRNGADLQALMIDELLTAQAKIASDDADSWRGFFDDQGVPFAEERCRDHLLLILRQGCEGISLQPETHVEADKEVDITCSVGDLRLPIEVKGQWNRDLWSGADAQLDKLYARDWQAEGRGIYLILWFGDQVPANKRLKRPPRGHATPETPTKLREAVASSSQAVQEGRIEVVVLDLTRA